MKALNKLAALAAAVIVAAPVAAGATTPVMVEKEGATVISASFRDNTVNHNDYALPAPKSGQTYILVRDDLYLIDVNTGEIIGSLPFATSQMK